jgi:CRISPR-associated protein Csd2
MSAIESRYDFVYFFDCTDGNPNGDPDSDNSPRIDPESFQGLVSDVCLKRKIRDYVYQCRQQNGVIEKGYDVFVLAGNTLESRQRQPFEHLEGVITPKGKDTKPTDIQKARDWMCQNFFDVRTFGAVMSTTSFNCGQVRGPLQLTFSRSVDRIFTTEHTISRQAFTGEKDIKSGTSTFGRKHTIAYGLYRAHGFLNPVFARQTGFSNEDLDLVWKALANMFDLDRSAARGLMAARRLYVFKHHSALGEAPAHCLFESVKVKLKDSVMVPRSFEDYAVWGPDSASLPPGVELLNIPAFAAFA